MGASHNSYLKEFAEHYITEIIGVLIIRRVFGRCSSALAGYGGREEECCTVLHCAVIQRE